MSSKLKWSWAGTPDSGSGLYSGTAPGAGRWEFYDATQLGDPGYTYWEVFWQHPPAAAKLAQARRAGMELPAHETYLAKGGKEGWGLGGKRPFAFRTEAEAKAAAQAHHDRQLAKKAKPSSGKSAARTGKPKSANKRWPWSSYKQGPKCPITEYTPDTSAARGFNLKVWRSGKGPIGGPGPWTWTVSKGRWDDDSKVHLAKGYATAADAKLAAQIWRETRTIPLPAEFGTKPKKAPAKKYTPTKGKPRFKVGDRMVVGRTQADVLAVHSEQGVPSYTLNVQQPGTGPYIMELQEERAMKHATAKGKLHVGDTVTDWRLLRPGMVIRHGLGDRARTFKIIKLMADGSVNAHELRKNRTWIKKPKKLGAIWIRTNFPSQGYEVVEEYMVADEPKAAKKSPAKKSSPVSSRLRAADKSTNAGKGTFLVFDDRDDFNAALVRIVGVANMGGMAGVDDKSKQIWLSNPKTHATTKKAVAALRKGPKTGRSYERALSFKVT